jgi:hypothetical protein
MSRGLNATRVLVNNAVFLCIPVDRQPPDAYIVSNFIPQEVGTMKVMPVLSRHLISIFAAFLCAGFAAAVLSFQAGVLGAQALPTASSISATELAEIRATLKELDPPATPEEAMLFRQFRENPADVQGFIATRKYLRLLGFPKPSKDFPLPSQAPKLLPGVDYKYTLSFDEEFPLFQIFLSQGLPAPPPK